MKNEKLREILEEVKTGDMPIVDAQDAILHMHRMATGLDFWTGKIQGINGKIEFIISQLSMLKDDPEDNEKAIKECEFELNTYSIQLGCYAEIVGKITG